MTSLSLMTSLLVTTLGCGTEPAADDGLPPQGYMLADGAEVAVDGHGAVIIRRGGRPIFSTAAGHRPRRHRFEDRIVEQLGSYRFIRVDEDVMAFDRFRGSEEMADGVQLRFATAEGDGASLEITPGPIPETTSVRLSADTEASGGALALPLGCDVESAFWAFGAQYNGIDQRGKRFPLWVSEQGIGRDGGATPIAWVGNEHTTYFPVPFFLDPRGFGVLIQTDARVVADLCATDEDAAWLEVEHGEPVDLLIIDGPTPLAVIERLGAVLGRPPMPPAWAFRPWIAIQGGREAVLGAADQLDAAEIPYSALWAQDWSGRREFAPGRFGVAYRWLADDDLYPDLAEMIATLHARDVRFLGYANPFVVESLEHFEEMRDGGMLPLAPDGQPYLVQSPNGPSSMPDLTSAAARDYAKRHLRAMVRDLGMDGWMADFGEWLPTDATLADGSDPLLRHNTYPTEWHRLSREVMDEEHADGDWVVFSRSGWRGEQDVAQIVWIGDQEADFSETDGLPTVLPALLNLGMSGIPFVTHDIAGFSGGPSDKELFIRWTELGAFTPIMRTHEGLQRAANWSWHTDAETIAHFRRLARVHDALLPELLALAEESARTSAPMLRHLGLAFPADATARETDDQAMLGDDLLIAPIVHPGVTSRQVYLPEGRWFLVWNGTAYDGGQHIEVAAPLGYPPVFSRNRDRDDLRAIE